MRTWNANFASVGRWFVKKRFAKKRFAKTSATLATLLLLTAGYALAQPATQTDEAGGEAALKLPDLSSVSFLGVDGHRLLMIGLLFCVFGLGFGWLLISCWRPSCLSAWFFFRDTCGSSCSSGFWFGAPMGAAASPNAGGVSPKVRGRGAYRRKFSQKLQKSAPI